MKSQRLRISQDSSRHYLFRAVQRLFRDGSPPGEIVNLTLRAYDDVPALPLGAMSLTSRDRLIYWPPLHPTAPFVFDDQTERKVDHLTLELSNGRTHITAFDGNERTHTWPGWAVQELDDSGLALWFIFAAGQSFLSGQARRVEWQISGSDAPRRAEEFRRFAEENIRTAEIEWRTPTKPLGDTVVTFAFISLRGRCTQSALKSVKIPYNILREICDEPLPAELLIARTPLKLTAENRVRDLVIVTACPPGSIGSPAQIACPIATRPAAGRPNL